MSILKNLSETTDYLRSQTDIKPQVGITLGSGLASFVDEIEVDVTIPYKDIPHFSPPTVQGHPGSLIFGHVGGKPIVALQGRIHFYEGHSMRDVVFPTRVLGLLGIETFILTNAAGGLADGIQPGCFMIILDQINMTGTCPLLGPNLDELGPRFPDMSEVYDKNYRKILKSVMNDLSVDYYEGNYLGVTGPAYETPAEIRYYKQIGAGAVGMSTVSEAIAAKHMGLKIAGISCVTNLGAGLSDEVLDHKDVTAVAKKVEKQFSELLTEFIARI